MPKLLAAPNAYARIYEWVMNRDTVFIEDKDFKIFERWDFCDNQLRKYGKQRDVEALMRAKFPNISMVQIKRDIENTKRLFSSIATINKGYEKLFLIEDIKETILTAKACNDLNARTKAQKNLFLVLGLDKDDEIDLSKLESHEYYITIASRDAMLKIDLLNLQKLAISNKKSISDFLESEITEADAFQILNPEFPSYDNQETIAE
ncbi:MAG: hypothetical protein ACOYOV_11355 [Bacteroidales bacterium]